MRLDQVVLMSLGCEVVKRIRSNPSISFKAQISCASAVASGAAVIGIHVLAQQRDFAHAALNQIARLVAEHASAGGLTSAPRV